MTMMNHSFIYLLLGSLLLSAVVAADDLSFALPSFEMNMRMNTRGNVDLDDLPDRLVFITKQHLAKVFNKVLLSSSGGSVTGSAFKEIDLSTTLRPGSDQFTTSTSEWRSSLLADFEGKATFHTNEQMYITDELMRGIMKYAFQNKVELRVLLQKFQTDDLLKHVVDMSVEIEEKQTDDIKSTPTQGDSSDMQEDRSGMSKGGIAALTTVMLCLALVASSGAGLFLYLRYCRHSELTTSDADATCSKAEKSTDDEASSTTSDSAGSHSSSDEEEGIKPTSHLGEWGSWARAVSLPTKPRPPRRGRRATLKKEKSSLMRLTLNVIEEEQDGDDDASLRHNLNSVRPVKDEDADVWSIASSSSGDSSLVEL
jgi:hypothetical protein